MTHGLERPIGSFFSRSRLARAIKRGCFAVAARCGDSVAGRGTSRVLCLFRSFGLDGFFLTRLGVVATATARLASPASIIGDRGLDTLVQVYEASVCRGDRGDTSR